MYTSRTSGLLAAAIVAALVCGCAMFERGPTDQELIECAVADYCTAVAEGDIDGIMAIYSEDFEGETGETKEDVHAFLSGAIDQGYMDDVEASADDCEITIDGDTATVDPVVFSSDFGDMSIGFTMKKEADGAWRIVGSSLNQ